MGWFPKIVSKYLCCSGADISVLAPASTLRCLCQKTKFLRQHGFEQLLIFASTQLGQAQHALPVQKRGARGGEKRESPLPFLSLGFDICHAGQLGGRYERCKNRSIKILLVLYKITKSYNFHLTIWKLFQSAGCCSSKYNGLQLNRSLSVIIHAKRIKLG